MKTAPIVLYYTISNLAYLFIEAIFYLVIGILSIENKATKMLACLVQGLSIGFMAWGLKIRSDQPFQDFMKLCEGNTVNHDLVITINEMIDLRIIYVIILIIFKIMWLFMPFFVKAFGLEPIKKQTKEDILHYLNSKAMNYDKKTCETETCAICLVDFESDESAKVV